MTTTTPAASHHLRRRLANGVRMERGLLDPVLVRRCAALVVGVWSRQRGQRGPAGATLRTAIWQWAVRTLWGCCESLPCRAGSTAAAGTRGSWPSSSLLGKTRRLECREDQRVWGALGEKVTGRDSSPEMKYDGRRGLPSRASARSGRRCTS